MTRTHPSKLHAKPGKVFVALLLCPMLLVASCTHLVHYRDVGVTAWTATTVGAAAGSEGETCVRACETERFRAEDGASMTQAMFLSPRPDSDEDCRAREAGSRYDPGAGTCLVGLNTRAYGACLATCGGASVEAGRCDRAALVPALECIETSNVIWTDRHQHGTCEEWRQDLPAVAVGGEPWCQDYVVTKTRAGVVAILAVVGVVSLVLVVGFIAFSSGDGPLSHGFTGF